MRTRTATECHEGATGINYTLIATPAEGLSGRFVRIDRERLRRYPRRDRPRLLHQLASIFRCTYDISAFDKITLEAPYHALTNGGHITYIELDGDPSR